MMLFVEAEVANAARVCVEPALLVDTTSNHVVQSTGSEASPSLQDGGKWRMSVVAAAM
jgi:hypothetical protein